MALIDQKMTDNYAVYNGDCIEIMKDLPDDSIGLSIYSPPFGGLYEYSSSERDLSNTRGYQQFFEHYEFVVKDLCRLMKSGRMTCVHTMDVPQRGDHGIKDFPGDIIRLHEKLGFDYWSRFAIWKEPLRVAIRTRAKHLAHYQIVKDSSLCGNAGADYLLVFRKRGENKELLEHPKGLNKYCGERSVPNMFENKEGEMISREEFRYWKNPKTNKLAHWIWQQYASSFWDDIRLNHVLPYRKARDSEEEKHVHPLQLDVIERCVILWSNSRDSVLTLFMGVGSEVYGALLNGRKGIGIELKESYYRQAVKNIDNIKYDVDQSFLIEM